MRSLPWKTLGAGLAVAITFAACADIFGLKNAESGDASVSPDGGGDDASADTIPPYDANKDVVTIPDANFAQCDGGVDDLTGAVFVSSSHPNKNSSSCGAATQPCSSIKIGIGVAAQQAPHKVVLANDVFDEVLELDGTTNGMTIEGGYSLDYTQTDKDGNPAWVPQCATNLARIVEGTTHPEPYVVRVTSASNITLRLLSVQSRDSKNYGESVYGIQVINSSSVTLDNVVVLAENGGDGTPGLGGASNNPPPFCGVDAGGGSGTNAPAGDAGAFQNDGYHVGQAPSGSSGDWGTYVPPMKGDCNSNCETCMGSFTPDAGQTCTGNAFQQCGNTGFGGCNGARGLGGGGGAGGGATVALYIFGSSSVTLVNGTVFETASGGMGGNGASGGGGDAGTTGGSAFPTSCTATCGLSGDGGGCSTTSSIVLDGGAGGAGGPGGNGGAGGGGAGGPSYLVVRVLPATLTPSFVSSVGDAGPGRPGDGGAPNGQTGDQGSIKVF